MNATTYNVDARQAVAQLKVLIPTRDRLRHMHATTEAELDDMHVGSYAWDIGAQTCTYLESAIMSVNDDIGEARNELRINSTPEQRHAAAMTEFASIKGEGWTTDSTLLDVARRHALDANEKARFVLDMFDSLD